MKRKKLRLKEEVKETLLFEVSNLLFIILMVMIYYISYKLNLL